MKLHINKYRAAIVLMVVVGAVLDLLTGYYQLVIGATSELTPGILYRGLILTSVFMVLIHKSKTDYFRNVAYYFLGVFLVGIGVHFLLGYEVELVNHAQRFLKIIFPILGFGALVYIERKFPRSQSDQFLWKAAGLYGLITVVSIVALFLLGKGLATYRRGFSSIAFFGSQNSMAFIFVGSLSSLLYYIYTYKRNNLMLILGVETLFLVSALLVGTRAGIVGVPATIVLFHGFTFFKKRRSHRWLSAFSSIVALAIMAIVGFAIYSYWASHYDISWIQNKFEVVLNQQDGIEYGTEHLRGKVPTGLATIAQFDVLEHLFGIGDAEFLLTENDFVDIYGKFGLGILVPLLLFFGYYYTRLVWLFVKKRSISVFVLLLSFSFYIIHAAIAGHALSIAQSNNLMMLLYYLAYREIALSYRKKSPVQTSVVGDEMYAQAL